MRIIHRLAIFLFLNRLNILSMTKELSCQENYESMGSDSMGLNWPYLIFFSI